MNRKKSTRMDQLAFLSVKQGIYPAELHQAMLVAREKGKTNCQNLLVEYRGSLKDAAIFLITKDNRSSCTVQSCRRTSQEKCLFRKLHVHGRNSKTNEQTNRPKSVHDGSRPQTWNEKSQHKSQSS